MLTAVTQWAGMFLFHILLSMKRQVKRLEIMENDESVAFGRISCNLFWGVRYARYEFLYFQDTQMRESE